MNFSILAKTIALFLIFLVSLSSFGQGNTLNFDGVNDVVEVTSTAAINFTATNSYTVEFWVNAGSDSGDEYIINSSNGVGAQQYAFDHFGGNFRFFSDVTGVPTLTMPRLTSSEGWVHVAGVFNGPSGEMFLYKNGELVDQLGSVSPTLNAITTPITVGANDNTGGLAFEGEMDELRFWNVARTQEQIIADAYVSLNSGPGLVASYNFNVGTAGSDNTGLTTLPDNTGTADGTLNGPFALSGLASNWVTSTAFDLDVFAPVITSAFTSDADQNGQIDLISVFFSEDIDGASVTDIPSEFTLGGGYVIASSTLNGTNGVDLILTESGSPDTDQIPDINLIAASLQDLIGNVNAAQVFTPSDDTPPAWISGFPIPFNFGETSFDIDVQLSETGVAYYVVVPDGATAPNIDDIRSGTGFGGTGQLTSGNINVTTASTTFTINVTGLSSGTDYDLYLVADQGGTVNPQVAATFFDISTTLPMILLSSTPAANSANVLVSNSITLDFDVAINLTSIHNGTNAGNDTQDDNIKIYGSRSGLIDGTYTDVSGNAEFTPTNDFFPGEEITVTVSDLVSGIGGEIAVSQSFKFQVSAIAGPLVFDEQLIDGTLGTTATHIEAGDINRDGFVDIVANDGGIYWYANDGFGNFGGSTEIFADAGGFWIDMKLKDVEGDGDLDVSAITTDGSGEVVWFENQSGDGSSWSGKQTLIVAGASAFTIADFNNDGFNDIVYGYSRAGGPTSNPTLEILFNDGIGGFLGAQTIDIESSVDFIEGLEASDLDGDGYFDLLVSAGTQDEVYWYANNGDETFAPKTLIETLGGETLRGVRAADLDNDLDPDVVLAVAGGSGQIRYYDNNALTFGATQVASTLFAPTKTFLVDMDGNGELDILTFEGQLVGNINLYPSTGPGTFGTGSTLFTLPDPGTGTSPLDNLVVADFDADGDLDIATIGGDFTNKSLSVYLQEEPQNALDFAGDDDFVSITRSALPSGLTYEAWINTTSTASASVYDGNPALTVIGDHDNDVRGGFGIHDGRVRYTHWQGTATDFDFIDGNAMVNDGLWHHIAVTHDNASNDVKIFVDGVLDIVATTTTYHADMSFDRVGGGYLEGTGTAELFVGSIDEVRIWDAVIGDSDIRDYLYMNDLTSNPNIGSLVLHYTMDQGIAGANNAAETTLQPQSGTSLSGTLNGFTLNGGTSNYISSTAFDHTGVVTPSLQATNISFFNISENSVDISWTNGDGQRRIVAMIEGFETEVPIPSDNQFFLPDVNFGLGDIVDGSWHAVYNGFENSTTVLGLNPSSNYTIAVLEVNGPAGFEAYNSGADIDNPIDFITNDVSGFTENFDDEVVPSTSFTGTLDFSSGTWEGQGILASGPFESRGGPGEAIVIEPVGGSFLQTPYLESVTSLNFWYKGDGGAGIYRVVLSSDGGTTFDLPQSPDISPTATYQEFALSLGTYNGPIRIERISGSSSLFVDDVSSDGFILNPRTFYEDFDEGTLPGVATTGPLLLSTGTWEIVNALESGDIDARDGSENALRLEPAGGNYIQTVALTEATSINFWYKGQVSGGTYDILASSDGGTTFDIPLSSINPDPTYQEFSYDFTSQFDPSYTGPVRIEFNAGANPLFIDDVSSDAVFTPVDATFDQVVVPDADFTAGSTNNLIYAFSINPSEPVETIGFILSLDDNAPNYTVDDFAPSPVKVWINTTEENFATATELASFDFGNPLPGGGSVAPNQVALLFAEILSPGVPAYLYASIDIDAGATIGNSFRVLAVDLEEQIGIVQEINALGSLNAGGEFTIQSGDVTAPVITVDTYGTSITSPQLTGTIDDPTATIEIEVDGITYTDAINNSDGTWTLADGLISALADGTYDVIATAEDAAGNVGTDDTVDELVISQTTIAINASNITSTSFRANWSEGLDVQTYQVDVSEVSDFSSFVDGFESFETTATNVVVSNLDFAQSYFYRVRVVNTASEVSDDSNTTALKTLLDDETRADSLALVQIFEAISPQGLNWETDRFRNWNGVEFDAIDGTRVVLVDLDGTGSVGDMPNPFTGDALSDGGLSNLVDMDLSGNEITGLIDFSATSIDLLNISNNSLTFGDIEPLLGLGITTLDYQTQANIQFDAETRAAFLRDDFIIVPHLDSYVLTTSIDGSGNTYVWYRDDVAISSGDDFTVLGNVMEIASIDFESMGSFRAEVSSTLVPGLVINIDPISVLATADITMRLTDSDDVLIEGETFRGALLETVRKASGYDTLSSTNGNVSSEFVFEDVILADYLCGIEPNNTNDFIPTYFGNAFEWELATTIEIRSDATLSIQMTADPPELTAADGEGSLAILIEEDFGDDAARTEARRRAKKRKCGLKQRRRGGRTEQDDEFTLIAYGETDDNGEFEFGFLPEGTYRFFVEYPGIPLDESSEVEFTVGEAGVSDTDFKLAAFATEDGIEISIEKVLGVILEYFKDLQIYPNPSRDFLNVSFRHLKSTDVTAQLVDLAGNAKWSSDLQSGFDGSIRIDVSDFSEGVYILRFYDRESPQDNVVSYRVIVRD